jgi:hypothetical protein
VRYLNPSPPPVLRRLARPPHPSISSKSAKIIQAEAGLTR